ncbi:Na/Pi cotransporter family protein, partial [Arenibaculum sp.]|uniref:Na/Pi cotransporter family protein n=1 Tax=Arenibaculum sp. TaxID=2865862 RepID=UPI002E155F1F|nr:Na/Pi cotransporter family protein [Arenibaculum sp.]
MPSSIAELAGGIALLLFSLAMVRAGIQRACGGELRRLLAAGTCNRLYAFGAGTVAAALLQSSTATALMATSFVGRGMLPVATGLAILLGADVGSTLAVQVLRLDLHWLGPLLLAGGTAAFLGARNQRITEAGRVAVGIGLLLLALAMIIGASAPLRDAPWAGAVAATLAAKPLVGLIAGGILAWIAHSSLSIVLLIVSLASTGALPLPAALALVIGANIGGTLPALALAASEPPAARRLPLGNLLFRSIGAAGAFLALPWLPDFIPGADNAHRIVNFHTGFNLAIAIVFLSLTGPFARLCARLLPDRPAPDRPGTPRYLDRSGVTTPPVALACAAREALRMGDIVAEMLDKSFLVLRDDDRRLLDEVERMDDDIDRLNEAIKLYLA